MPFFENILSKLFTVPKPKEKREEVPEVVLQGVKAISVPEPIIQGPGIISVPNICDLEAEVVEICVMPGDVVDYGQALVVAESDKATLEIPSPRACRIEEIIVRIGSFIKENYLLFRVSEIS